MKVNSATRRVLAVVALLLVTNGVTAWAVHSRDFSSFNQDCFLNWGMISGAFEDRPHYNLPQDPLELYRIYESNALFDARYPAKATPKGKMLNLFCWAVAADSYSRKNHDVKVDPLVWQAFVKDGPKELPTYWEIRGNLERAGAGSGLIRGSTPFAHSDKPAQNLASR